ncbi:PRELI-like family-domain-containing protein, partial [Lineolata rhizophorae]
MVKFYTSTDSYNYAFPAVSLAYLLRYPNPYSTHVLSTDVIDRRFDPRTHTLHTLRLHLKRSKLPRALLRLLPRSLASAAGGPDAQSYILERSAIDVRNGCMWTESRNLEWTGVLSVVERQEYLGAPLAGGDGGAAQQQGEAGLAPSAGSASLCREDIERARTDVRTTVALHSRLGQGIFKRKDAAVGMDAEDAQPAKQGFFKSWSTASLQRSIELIGLRRTRSSQPNAKEGMKVVLERLREGGLVAVLEGMRRDREVGLGG